MWTFSYLASFATLWQNLFAQHQLGWLSMRSAEWVWQRGSSCDVTAGLSRNRRACVLRRIIGVPCNVPLPRGSAPCSSGSPKWVESGLNGAPVGFKQTQHSPPLFYMLHPTAGSPTAAHSDTALVTPNTIRLRSSSVCLKMMQWKLNIWRFKYTLYIRHFKSEQLVLDEAVLQSRYLGLLFFLNYWFSLTENKCLRCM